MRSIVFATLLVAATLTSCSNAGNDAPASGACRLVALGTCAEYPAGAPMGFSAAGCASAGGVWLDTCPVEGRLGTCLFTVPAGAGGAPITASETFYPGLLATPDEAAAACTSLEGAFTAGTARAGPATEQAFSCDARAVEGTCSDYSGLWEPERRTAVEATCTMNGSSVLPAGTSCPTLGRTGTCRLLVGSTTRSVDVRYYDPATAAADEAACGPFPWTSG